jgi:hypothetical protein
VTEVEEEEEEEEEEGDDPDDPSDGEVEELHIGLTAGEHNVFV